jgi:hypothetical protein
MFLTNCVASSQPVPGHVQYPLRALTRGSRRYGTMQWFVQTPEHSFKHTLRHSILVHVFSLESCRCEYTPFHAQWCASGA